MTKEIMMTALTVEEMKTPVSNPAYTFNTEINEIIINIINDVASGNTPKFQYNSLSYTLHDTFEYDRKERGLYTTPFNFNGLTGSVDYIVSDNPDKEYIKDVNNAISMARDGCALIYNAITASHGEIIVYQHDFISSILVDMYVRDLNSAETMKDIPFMMYVKEYEDLAEYKEQIDTAMSKFSK